jgi:hypothetical protein
VAITAVRTDEQVEIRGGADHAKENPLELRRGEIEPSASSTPRWKNDCGVSARRQSAAHEPGGGDTGQRVTERTGHGGEAIRNQGSGIRNVN